MNHNEKAIKLLQRNHYNLSMSVWHAGRHVHGLRFTAKVFAPFYSKKQDYCGTKIKIPVNCEKQKTGHRNGKYRNPEDSGRNMQPSSCSS
jgi:hypothetical protein